MRRPPAGSRRRLSARPPGWRPGCSSRRRGGRPPKDAVGELSRQMAELLGQMAAGLADAPSPKRAMEWLERTRALRGEIERVDDALAQAGESIRLNPRRLRLSDPAAGLREGVNTLERAATDMRVLARSVADGARLDSEH